MNKERLNPHFNINAKYEAMIRDSKEIVKHYLSKESNGEPNEGVCLAYDVKNYLPSLLEENKELHNKIDEISEFIKENKIKRYRPIEGEEYDEEILLDEDDITCLERIINDEYDYENR